MKYLYSFVCFLLNESSFFALSQYVKCFGCFPVMIQNISKEASTRAKLVMCFNNSKSWSEDLASKINLSPTPPLVASAAVRSRVVVLLLFNLFFIVVSLFVSFLC